MKRLGVLVIGRDYFIPYVEWLTSMDGKLFDISGFIDNEDPIYAQKVPGYADKRNALTLEEMAAESDMILSLSYWQIIPKSIINIVPNGIINLHNSYMLEYRGRHAISWAIINNEEYHGTTLHYMSEKLDDGPIIASVGITIDKNDTAHALFTRINDAAFKMIKENVPLALNAASSADVVTHSPSKKFKTYKKRDLVHHIPTEWIKSDPEKFSRYVRALTFPGMPKPYIIVDGVKIYVSAE